MELIFYLFISSENINNLKLFLDTQDNGSQTGKNKYMYICIMRVKTGGRGVVHKDSFL